MVPSKGCVSASFLVLFALHLHEQIVSMVSVWRLCVCLLPMVCFQVLIEWHWNASCVMVCRPFPVLKHSLLSAVLWYYKFPAETKQMHPRSLGWLSSIGGPPRVEDILSRKRLRASMQKWEGFPHDFVHKFGCVSSQNGARKGFPSKKTHLWPWRFVMLVRENRDSFQASSCQHCHMLS